MKAVTRRSALAVSALILGAAGAAYGPAALSAGQSASATTASTTSIPAADKNFAMKAAEGGMGEVELGKLVQSKAQSDQVKSFAERMVKDHSAAGDKLKDVASKDGLQLPSKMDSSSQKLMDKLQKLSGADFDKAYMNAMVTDHQKDIKEFEHESKSGRNSDLKQFATDTLPTLREHLSLAQQAKTAAMNEARGSSMQKQASSSSTSTNKMQ